MSAKHAPRPSVRNRAQDQLQLAPGSPSARPGRKPLRSSCGRSDRLGDGRLAIEQVASIGEP
jgi:hypothetical protein